MGEIDIDEVVRNLRNPSRLISENREAVVVYRDELEAVLTRLEELEGRVAELPDTETGLEVGDLVQTLIDYKNTPKGERGVVETILNAEIDGGEYPYRIRFENEKYAIGYNRAELGKVVRAW